MDWDWDWDWTWGFVTRAISRYLVLAGMLVPATYNMMNVMMHIRRVRSVPHALCLSPEHGHASYVHPSPSLLLSGILVFLIRIFLS